MVRGVLHYFWGSASMWSWMMGSLLSFVSMNPVWPDELGRALGYLENS